MKGSKKSTALMTKSGSLYIVVWVEAGHITDINGKVPEGLIIIEHNKKKITTINNPEGELLLLMPPGAADVEYGPKSICLAGFVSQEEEFVCAVPYEHLHIEPTYRK